MTQRNGSDRSDATALAGHVAVFEALRPRLTGVAYRLLGSVADAEDVVQEGWLRWSGVDLDDIDTPEAFLTTVVTRLALDRLRSAKVRREVYTGSWLPEPVVAVVSPAEDPQAAVELADSLSMALLVVLEALSPLERAAFVLHEVFQRPYPEIAAALGRSEAAVRQLLHRARTHVDAGHTRYRTDQATHTRVVQRFLAALENADLDELMQVLAPDVVIISDGGGLAPAPRRPVHGRDKVTRLLVGISQRGPAGMVVSLEVFNGAVGIVGRVAGTPVAALAITTGEGSIWSLQLVANPDKLRSLYAGRTLDLW